MKNQMNQFFTIFFFSSVVLFNFPAFADQINCNGGDIVLNSPAGIPKQTTFGRTNFIADLSVSGKKIKQVNLRSSNDGNETLYLMALSDDRDFDFRLVYYPDIVGPLRGQIFIGKQEYVLECQFLPEAK